MRSWVPRRAAILSIVLAGTLVQACGDDGRLPTDPPALPPITGLRIAQRLPSVYANDTLQLHVDIAFEGEEDPDSLASVVWTSLDPDVATVDAEGLVVGARTGFEARVVASTAAVEDTVRVAVVPRRFGAERGLSYVEVGSTHWLLYRASLDGAPRQLSSDSAYFVRSYDWADVPNLRLTNYAVDDSIFSVVGSANGDVALTLAIPTPEGRWEPGVPSRIAFRDAAGRLSVLDGVTSPAPAPVTSAAGEKDAWSPDGRQIAFLSLDQRLLSAPMDGSPLVEFETLGGVFGFAWAPDGKRIAFNTSGAAWVIAAHGDGATLRHLVPACAGFGTCPVPINYTVPAWASDARRVAFGVRSNEGCFVFVLEAATRGAEAVLPSPCVQEVAWSPNDAWIAVASNALEPDGDGVLLLRADGSERRFLPSTGPVIQIRWIP